MDLIEWNVVERSCKPECKHEIKKGEEVMREDVEVKKREERRVKRGKKRKGER